MLTHIKIPKSLESASYLNSGTFGNSGLSSVEFEEGTTRVVGNLFYNATKLTNVPLLDTITEIRNDAFSHCTALTNIDIPDSVVKIENDAFNSCTALTNIDIPNSVTTMGENIFSGCTSLEKVKLPNSRQNIMAGTFYNCKKLKDIVLPETVTAIRQNAFYGCASLPSINLPDGLQTIEDNAFYECKALTDITIPKNVTSIGTSAFYNCDGLQTAVINASGTVGSQAFYDCDALTSLTLADSITKIGSSLCYGCDKLTDIKFGKYIIEIPDSSFRKCSALQSVTLPRFCKTVAANAFAEDTKLTEAYVPASVSSIQDNSFSYPRKMTVYGKDGSYAQEYASNKKMTFSAVNAPITEVSFADKAVTVDKYKTFTEPLNISPDFDTDTITFTSSDASVATVSETGVIYTKKNGAAVITAKANDGNKTAMFTVNVSSTKITVDTVTAQQGESFIVPVRIAGNTGVCGATLTFDYSESLTLTNITKGDGFSSLTMTKPGSYSSGSFVLVWDGLEADTSDGVIAYLTFTAPETEGSYDISVSFDEGDIVDGDLNPVNAGLVQGKSIITSRRSVNIKVNDVDYTLTSKESTAGIILVSFYDENGKFISLKRFNDTKTQINVSSPQNAETAKLMWWSSLTGLKPIGDTKKIIL